MQSTEIPANLLAILHLFPLQILGLKHRYYTQTTHIKVFKGAPRFPTSSNTPGLFLPKRKFLLIAIQIFTSLMILKFLFLLLTLTSKLFHSNLSLVFTFFPLNFPDMEDVLFGFLYFASGALFFFMSWSEIHDIKLQIPNYQLSLIYLLRLFYSQRERNSSQFQFQLAQTLQDETALGFACVSLLMKDCQISFVLHILL